MSFLLKKFITKLSDNEHKHYNELMQQLGCYKNELYKIINLCTKEGISFEIKKKYPFNNEY